MRTSSTEDRLRERLHELQQKVDEQQRTIDELRHSARELENLLELFSGELYYVRHAGSASPTVEPIERSSGAASTQEGLQALLCTAEGGRRQREVIETGRKQEFQLAAQGEEASKWMVSLTPAVRKHEGEETLLALVRPLTEREQELQKARDQTSHLYNELIELIPDAVTIVDEHECIQYINSSGVNLLGADGTDEVVGKSIWTYVHSDEKERLHAEKDRLEKGRPVGIGEHRLVRLDGETVPVETMLVPITYQDRPAILMTVRDMRERQKMANALSRTLNLFHSLFQLGPASMAIVRLSDHVILEANEAFLTLTGQPRKAVIGNVLDEFCDLMADGRSLLGEHLLHEGTTHNVELSFSQNESERTLLASAQIVETRGQSCALIVGVDITKRKQVAEAEQESRDLLKKIFRASPASILITREVDGLIIESNDAFARLTGYEREELIGHTTQELDIWGDPERRIDFVRKVREATPGGLHDYEIEIRTRSGQKRTLLFSVQRIRIDGMNCLLSVGTDITMRKQAEQALLEAKEHAEDVAQFRSGVLSNVTHEIRTPLTVILGFTSMLREGVRDEYHRFVDLIERSGRRLLVTLDAVLDLAQLEADTIELNREPHNVADLVSSAVGSVERRALEKGLELNVDLPPDIPTALIDYELLERVLDHLLDNALKFTNEGRIDVIVRLDGGDIIIEIQDTGIGIGEEFLPHVFEAFRQESTGLDRSYQGSGLGLTVSKQIVERLGGHLEVSSERGKGCIVSIQLPRHKRNNTSTPKEQRS